MSGIKIPQQDFVLQMQWGLCVRGGIFAGDYGIMGIHMTSIYVSLAFLQMIYAFLLCQHFQPHTPSAVDDDDHEDNDQPKAIVG